MSGLDNRLAGAGAGAARFGTTRSGAARCGNEVAGRGLAAVTRESARETTVIGARALVLAAAGRTPAPLVPREAPGWAPAASITNAPAAVAGAAAVG